MYVNMCLSVSVFAHLNVYTVCVNVPVLHLVPLGVNKEFNTQGSHILTCVPVLYCKFL